MIKHFLELHWKGFFRSPQWKKSIGLKLILAFFGFILASNFLVFAIHTYFDLKKQFPDSNPLLKINASLFTWLVADLSLRFFLQKLPIMNAKPFLIVPIKRKSIVNFILGKSVLSFFNFLPLFATIPFTFLIIINENMVLEPLVWMLLVTIGSLIINYTNFLIENLSNKTSLSVLPTLVIVSTLSSLNHFEIVPFSQIISDFANSSIHNTTLLLVPLAILVVLYYFNYQSVKKRLYLDDSLRTKTEVAKYTEMNWTRNFGDIAPFIQLDLKLIMRNKRTKSTLMLLVIALFYGLLFYPSNNYGANSSMFMFVGIFITGIFLINFGQFIPAWDSNYYSMLMSQNLKYKQYLDSKYGIMAISSAIMFTLSLPYVYFGWNIIMFHLVAMIYNIGVNSHVLLWAGSFNRKKIDLSQRAAFNYQGTGAVQWLVSIPLLLVPLIIFATMKAIFSFEIALLTISLLGIGGVVLHNTIMKKIIKRYKGAKYDMLKAFNSKEF